VKIWVDGSGAGKYCYLTETNINEIFEMPNLTNNEAEYIAVKNALGWACIEGLKEVEILSDSQLIVKQLNHDWHIKEDRLRTFAQTIWNFIRENNMNVKFTWIPREKNKAGKLLG
jgi:ribonuclease HI